MIRPNDMMRPKKNAISRSSWINELEIRIFTSQITYFGLCSKDFPYHLQTLLLMNIAIKILYFQTFQLKVIL